MATEKRLIDAKFAQHIANVELTPDEAGVVQWVLSHTPTVDAIPVDEIKLHRIIIDNEGVPEVKIQIGDRYFLLRTDPVDVREVVHSRFVNVADFGDGEGCFGYC